MKAHDKAIKNGPQKDVAGRHFKPPLIGRRCF